MVAQVNFFEIDALPDCIQSESTLMVGDFNALHTPCLSNRNGSRLKVTKT